MRVERLQIDLDDKTLVDIEFEITRSLALVGQSGSGKSLTLKALLGMLPATMRLHLDYDADFVLKRGETIGFVPQNPFTALSPLTKIKDQFFIEGENVKMLFEHVGLDPVLLERFAPELSGGQLQRVVIAMALGSSPQLLLLDEPTTALDPQTREVIIALLKALQEEMGFKMLFVTHDIASAAALCDTICVIKNGTIQEHGTMHHVMQYPASPYTQTLIDASFVQREFRV